jgi:hypothetical protein
MSISLYDASVGAYLQTLGGVANVLDKGAQAAADGTLDLEEVVRFRLREDMATFTFQVISVWHHSLGAVNGLKARLFQPPPNLGHQSYQQLQGLVAEAISGLQQVEREEIDALADQPMIFRLSSREIPFTTDNFVLSFSLPNFYFHATTTYAILRMHGVPLGKMDYLGNLRMGS